MNLWNLAQLMVLAALLVLCGPQWEAVFLSGLLTMMILFDPPPIKPKEPRND